MNSFRGKVFLSFINVKQNDEELKLFDPNIRIIFDGKDVDSRESGASRK